jgi:hypothetical protein
MIYSPDVLIAATYKSFVSGSRYTIIFEDEKRSAIVSRVSVGWRVTG